MELIFRRLMKHHIDIIDGIKDIGIEMNKGILSYEDICLVTNKYTTLLNEMDEVYWCIRSLIIDDNLIEETRIHIKNNFLLRELKLPVTPSTYLLEDYILSSIEGGIADKIEDHIEISHQVGERLEIRYRCVTNYTSTDFSN